GSITYVWTGVAWESQVNVPVGESRVIPFDTLDAAINSTDTSKIFAGASLNLKERSTGNGGGAMWDVVEASTVTPNGFDIVQSSVIPALSLKLRLEGYIDLNKIGGTGNYTIDSTPAIDRAMQLFSEKSLPITGTGIFRYTGTLNLPEGVLFEGTGGAKIATFPQTGGDKSKLRPGYKDKINGFSIIFDGTGSVDTYNTNRSDNYSSFKPMVIYPYHAPYQLKGVAFIQDMDVLDSSGVLTTAANDNRATQYTAGMVTQSTLSTHFDFTLFGYWTVGGMIIHNQNGGNIDPDYNGFNNSLINGGLAIIGHDTAAGAASEGMTGNRFVETGIYGADHHNRPDGYYDVPVFYIDGFLLGSAAGIRGTNFTACNLRGYANDAVVTDHCDDLGFVNTVTEFSTLPGVPNADQEGKFIGTANTKRFLAVNLPSTGGIGMNEYISSITGPFQVMGAGGFDNVAFGKDGGGVRLSGLNGDSRVQFTNNFSSSVSGWVLQKDLSTGDTLNLLYDNAISGTFDKAGGMRNGLLGMPQGSLTINSGEVSLGTFNYIAING
ncbi:MAG: hypothetical protein GY905_06885, partial [Gammaproteobacteria bacterium]|nr:hypothetical protein [Gammaproteobacteria bacterium]